MTTDQQQVQLANVMELSFDYTTRNRIGSHMEVHVELHYEIGSSFAEFENQSLQQTLSCIHDPIQWTRSPPLTFISSGQATNALVISCITIAVKLCDQLASWAGGD